jgi:hypothetical protein
LHSQTKKSFETKAKVGRLQRKSEREDVEIMNSSGLPDGLFPNQKSKFGKNFQGLRLENVDIFEGH